MNPILKTAIALSSTLVLLGQSAAASNDAKESTANSSPGVVTKVEKAVVKGAKAAASGVERGAKAAGRGIERGAKATERAAKRVAAKVRGAPASSPAPGK